MQYQQQIRLDKINRDKFFLLDKSHQNDIIKLKISGSTLNVYEVSLSINSDFPKISCTCPDSKSWAKKYGCVCKHCCFTISKVFKHIDVDNFLKTYIFKPTDIVNIIQQFNNINLNLNQITPNTIENYNPNSIIDTTIIQRYHSCLQNSKDNKTKFNYQITPNEKNECPICYDGFVETDKINKCPQCNKCFHTNCIELWFKSGRNTCPYCRDDSWKDYLHKNKYINLFNKIE